MVMSGYPSPPGTQYQGDSNEQPSNGSNSNEIVTKMTDPPPNQPESNASQAPTSDSSDEDRQIKFEGWGFDIDRLFEVAYRFYKRNESKAFHPSFDERNQMNALIMQARYGDHDGGRAPDIGVLDLVGKRRQYEWSLLKGMSKTEAMTKFICDLDEICPIFKAHAEAVKISSGNDRSQDRSDRISFKSNGMTGQNQDSKLSETNAQLQSIYTSLCKQTHEQFKKYAEKQHPSDLVQQKYLITSLQEQYYQQYISQMHPELKSSLPNSSQTSNPSSNIPSSMPSPSVSELSTTNEVSSSNINTSPHVATHVVAPLGQASPEPPLSASGTTSDAHKQSDERQPMSGANIPVTAQTINLETGNHIEADISSEELNSEIPTDIQKNSPISKEGRPSADLMNVQSIKTSHPPPLATHRNGGESSPQLQNNNIVEPVKLYQNTEMPRIGMFESFPEPKLIQKPTQRSTPIDLINPNLPTLPPLPLEIQRNEPSKEPIISSKPSFEPSPRQSPIPDISNHVTPPPLAPAMQNTTYISMDTTSQSECEQPQLVQPHHEPSGAATHEFYRGIDLTDGREVNTNEAVQDQPPAPAHQDCLPDPPTWDDPVETYRNDQQEPTYEPLEPATLWTKGTVSEFKESLGGDKQGGVYEIKESALVIIQVPTYPAGKYIYWEFATDDYDIGFGVDFVYERNLAQPLALNIYEDNDDDDLEDLVDGDGWDQASSTIAAASKDPECGRIAYQGDHNLAPGQQQTSLNERDRLISEKRRRLANTISIIPTYRRDSHEDVVVGRHRYPGQGYYLLRFDNTYSVLRSKTLYFRICYFI